uniref:Uncharacterized protein n=1 Tax=Ditylenchus dipsaci TaxID=166011 RepID=A0A915DQ83_9BILA
MAGAQQTRALSFTTDIWSSTSYSFISLTAHGINQEWKRDKYVLAIRELQGSHTADVINTAIREILEEWEIKQEVCHVIVRDGAANMKKAFEENLHKAKMAKRFEGKVVIVTGASSGIGQETAVAFGQEGAILVIHGQNEERISKTESLLKEAGVPADHILKVFGSMQEQSTQEKIVNETVKKFGKIDVLVNNAGTGHNPMLHWMLWRLSIFFTVSSSGKDQGLHCECEQHELYLCCPKIAYYCS